MPSPTNPADNLILANLPPDEIKRLSVHLEPFFLTPRHVIASPNDQQPHVYFPVSCMLSSIIILKDGKAVEAVTIGKEGMGGVGMLVNERASPFRVISQVQGDCWRVDANRFEELMEHCPHLVEFMKRYTLALLHQAGQNAACNLHHRVEARLVRWLLQTSDRVGSQHFHITQDFLSDMLGVSRQTISSTAHGLQSNGLISYVRGNVRLIDRAKLESIVCECYHESQQTYTRFMKFESSADS